MEALERKEQPDAFTVTEFCERHRISRAHLYDLIREGRGPRVMRPGRRTLISREAASDWRREMEKRNACAANPNARRFER